MKKIRLHVFGYRDITFWNCYGPIVRDLMMVKALCEQSEVHDIIFYNRPVSLLEIMLFKKRINYSVRSISNKLKFVSAVSFDFFGPIGKRRWLDRIYEKHYDDVELNCDYINIVLDFLPIGRLPKWAFGVDVYWYDMIDNFTKHNRFSAAEKDLVRKKYELISSIDNCFISAVSAAAIKELTCSNKLVLPNGLSSYVYVKKTSYEYDFGFMGFITDKFDIALIAYLSESGYKIAVYGEFYDRKIKVALEKLDGVYIHGSFDGSDAAWILETFKVGLLPYLSHKLHDESPLKLYQYICAGKNVLSSSDFGLELQHLFVYHKNDFVSPVMHCLANTPPSEGFSRDFFESNCWGGRVQVAIKWLLNNGS